MTHEFNSSRKSLVEILSDEALQEYAFGDASALTLEQLPEELKQTGGFEATVALVGWPDEEDGRNLAPVYDYAGIREFIESNFGSESGEYDFSNPKMLNNFNTLLKYEPFDPTAGEMTANDRVQMSLEQRAASTHPALIRAQLVVPELLDELRDRFDKSLSAREMYSSDPYAPQAAYFAYRVIGRLVSRYDGQIQARLDGQPEDVVMQIPLETSAHESIVR
jgi:hypothetical protein